MKLDLQERICYEKKVKFVESLNEAMSYIGNIDVVEYLVFADKNDIMREYLAVKYKGGALQARNCEYNSEGAIFEELAKMLYSSQVYLDDTVSCIIQLKDSVPLNFIK